MFVNARKEIVNHSCTPLATGGSRFGESLKRKRIGIVSILTDDCEINFGLLLRNDEQDQIRVGTCVDGRRQTWQVLAIPRRRIKRLTTIG